MIVYITRASPSQAIAYRVGRGDLLECAVERSGSVDPMNEFLPSAENKAE